MGRHRPEDRKHKGDSEVRYRLDPRAVRIHFEDRSKYKGEAIIEARHNNGVGRPPKERMEQLWRQKSKIYGGAHPHLAYFDGTGNMNYATRGKQNDMEL